MIDRCYNRLIANYKLYDMILYIGASDEDIEKLGMYHIDNRNYHSISL